jgi:phage terminase large subunit
LTQAKIRTNKVFKHLLKSDKKIIIEQGGARSGKTYNILLWIVTVYCNQNSGKVITICRKTFPAIRSTVMRDFIEILRNNNIYDPENHNRSSSEYWLYDNLVEFISLDQAQKVRGRKRDLLFINEANELSYEDWQQLIFRTTGRIIIDYNPADEYHWIYEKVIPREDAEFHRTTFMDNPFLEQSIIDEIKRLKDLDPNYWRVYGLGLQGSNEDNVFSNFEMVDNIPESAKLVSYGLDFGYSIDPTAVVGVYKNEDSLYLKEIMYEKGLTNQDVAEKLKPIIERNELICDSAEPKSIEELYRMGINSKPATKGRDSIQNGIDILKRHKIYIENSSLNLIKEFKNYKWQVDKNGKKLNIPVDKFNHLIDSVRYVALIHLKQNRRGWYSIR